MLGILYNIVIEPIKLLFSFLFSSFYKISDSYGISIILMSLFMNFLLLPLYRRADDIQDEENRIEKKMEKGVAHIKKSFKGDERYMILQAYYKENNYKPTYVLRGILPLLLEIPFFMAAYSFLSNLECLEAASFGPIADLALEDGLLFGFNLLPVLMTLINIISSSIYSKDAPLKSKIQLYLMALVFLVLLYTSPSGLVLYWTLNNLFSLVKNIIAKLPNNRIIIKFSLFILGLSGLIFTFFIFDNDSIIKKLVLIVLSLILLCPLFIEKLNIKLPDVFKDDKNKNLIFVLSSLFIALLVGLYIPTTVINSSPGEFVDSLTLLSPVNYIFSSLYLGIGIFVVWLGVYYLLSSDKVKSYFTYIVLCICLVAIVNYFFFDNNFGNMSKYLVYDEMFNITTKMKLINLSVDLVICFITYLIYRYGKSILKILLSVSVVSLIVLSIINIKTIVPIVENTQSILANSNQKEKAYIPLSKEGNNVVVIMLDRAISSFVPYMFNEKDILQEQFKGFTYYPNTLSYGAFTNVGSIALVGGYEYTPLEVNKRSDESLEDKHNEALKVLPVLFGENDYTVTVCDPPYAGYSLIEDLSIYDDYPYISTYDTNKGMFFDKEQDLLSDLKRNLFCYSLFRISPSIAKTTLYDNGNYHKESSLKIKDDSDILTQMLDVNAEFINNYVVLDNLSNMTQINEGNDNTYFFIDNDTPHELTTVHEPDYTLEPYASNKEYDNEHLYRCSFVDDSCIKVDPQNDMVLWSYQINMVTMLKLGEWFDYLRENDLYDNTRIIVVSDHGRNLGLNEDLIMGEEDNDDLMFYNALLMVKDFNCNDEFIIDDTFMTNADVPTIATNNLIENPINPFTGNPINSDKKDGEQYVLFSEWNTKDNDGNIFEPIRWYSVHDNVLDINKWSKLDVLPLE